MGSYGTIFILFMLAGVVSLTVFALATFIGPRADNARKAEPFECGNPPLGTLGRRVTVKFYVVALLFIVFDLETVFLYPWAVTYRETGWLGFWTMFTFVSVLALGLVYVWRKGILDWK